MTEPYSLRPENETVGGYAPLLPPPCDFPAKVTSETTSTLFDTTSSSVPTRLWRRSRAPRRPLASSGGFRPRMVDRASHFAQSRGNWNIRRTYRRVAAIPPRVLEGEEEKYRGRRSLMRYCNISPHLFRMRFYSANWFHSMLSLGRMKLLFFLMTVYFTIVLVFAVFYLVIALGYTPEEEKTSFSEEDMDKAEGMEILDGTSCGMDISSYLEAVYFSLSTMTTIGYGDSDYYFGNCWTPLMFVIAQYILSMVFNAMTIGLLFQRISRANKRARTVLFGDMAVIRRIRGRLYFMFQVCELRNTQLSEARVRVYCVRHEREKILAHDERQNCEDDNTNLENPNHDYDDGRGDDYDDDDESIQHPSLHTAYYQTHAVRLQHPDDSLGSLLLMSLPSVVVHRLDEWSPLVPPPLWIDRKGQTHSWLGVRPPLMEEDGGSSSSSDEEDKKFLCQRVVPGFPDLLQRACDKEAEARVLLQTEHGLVRRRAASVPKTHMMQSHLSSVCMTSPNKGEKGECCMEQGVEALEGKKDAVDTNSDEDIQRISEGVSLECEGIVDLEGAGTKMDLMGVLANGMSPLGHQSQYQPPHCTLYHGGNDGPAFLTDKEWKEKKEKRRTERYLREQKEITNFLKDRESEMVVLVEGVDEITGSTIQARHSYRHDDVAWNMTFAPCVSRGREEDGDGPFKGCVMDFGRFHYLVDASLDCERSPLITNIG